MRRPPLFRHYASLLVQILRPRWPKAANRGSFICGVGCWTPKRALGWQGVMWRSGPNMAKPTSPGKALGHAAEQAQSVLDGVPPVITSPEFPDTSVALPDQALPLPEQAGGVPDWLLS